MKQVVACLVLAVAVAGCGGGESFDCAAVERQVGYLRSQADGAEDRLNAEKSRQELNAMMGFPGDLARIQNMEADIRALRSDIRLIQADLRANGCP